MVGLLFWPIRPLWRRQTGRCPECVKRRKIEKKAGDMMENKRRVLWSFV